MSLVPARIPQKNGLPVLRMEYAQIKEEFA
jgi:hypothetical protein